MKSPPAGWPRISSSVFYEDPGTAIDWPKLDVQLSVAGLLAGNFGTPSWMARQASPQRCRTAKTKARK